MLTALTIVVILAGAALIWELRKMSEALDRLTNEVTEQTSVIDSAVTLLATLSQQIRDNIGNDDALNALADELDSNSNRLADAVAANTPAATEQPEEPEEPTA